MAQRQAANNDLQNIASVTPVNEPSTISDASELPLPSPPFVARGWRPIELDDPLSIDQLPTPALVIERAAFERNLRRMQDHIDARGKAIRPHAKTHKCPIIAHAQIELGAVGICAAKVSEASVMVNAGIHAVLITSPLTTPLKARALANLTDQSNQISIVIDSEISLEMLVNEIPKTARLGVLLDIDVEMGRTGIREIERLKRLRDSLLKHTQLHFEGVQHYAGHLMHVRDYGERCQRSLAGWERVCKLIGELERDGPSCAVVTGSGTGTYDIDCEVDRVTDLQVGSYAFMDREYQFIGSARGERFDDFEVSLTLASTVISRPTEASVTFDAGSKTLASDTVAPVLLGKEDQEYQFAGDEHGMLSVAEGDNNPLQIGSVHKLITPHCDPTVNLHDYYWVMEEDDLVHSAWPIAARGCSW